MLTLDNLSKVVTKADHITTWTMVDELVGGTRFPQKPLILGTSNVESLGQPEVRAASMAPALTHADNWEDDRITETRIDITSRRTVPELMFMWVAFGLGDGQFLSHSAN